MFFAEGQIRVHLYGAPSDMRKSYDGLQALARHTMGRDPLDGALYVFVNRRGTQLKCLYFDRSGFCIWGKRLEAGCFISDWSKVHTREMDWTGLKLLLEGIEPGKRRKRYQLPKSEKKYSEKSDSNTSSNNFNPLQSVHASSAAEQPPERS
jgi:transposase